MAYGGGAGTLAGQVGSGTGMAVGGRRGMSDIAWHPDNVSFSSLTYIYSFNDMQATRVVTASEDDSSPIIMVWDLRNARAPEKVRLDLLLVGPLIKQKDTIDTDRTRKRCSVPLMV